MTKERIASGILPIASNTKQICLAWRSAKCSRGNRWGIIGGMLENPELDLVGNAVSELIEETGYNGPVEPLPAFVWRVPGFAYYSYIGIVPEPFLLNPGDEFAWETDFLKWESWSRVQEMVQENPKSFHKGLLTLFREAKSLIEKFV
jgi:8-oxo-dGTP pyrophosphatase MutT (NUDIX family)